MHALDMQNIVVDKEKEMSKVEDLSVEELNMIEGGCVFCDGGVVLGVIAAWGTHPVVGVAVTIGAVLYFANK